MNMYESRYRNAKRIMDKINDLIAQGYRVIDEDNNVVEQIIEEDDTISYTTKQFPDARDSLFVNDVEWDDGIHTTIKEFNKRFEDWTYLNPKYIKKLKL